jgi:copper chaperone CopZ
VRRALEGLDGVTAVSVDLVTGQAIVDYREGVVSDARAIDAVQATVILPGIRKMLSRLGATRSRRVNR